MSDHTHIEWTDATWNPITGCSVVSAGCKHCYAMKLAGTRLAHHPSRAGLTVDTKAGPVWNGQVRFNEQWIDQPLRWRRPRRIFVCAHGDLFHENVPDEWIAAVFGVMRYAKRHTFQVLTKRPQRMYDWLQRCGNGGGLGWITHDGTAPTSYGGTGIIVGRDAEWPPPNVWLGVSVENQETADERIPLLLQCPAAVRWISAEPLLGPINFRWVPYAHQATGETYRQYIDRTGSVNQYEALRMLDWVVAGGESGAGARPMHPDWARSLRDQCAAAGVPFLFKQWGDWLPEDQREAWRFVPQDEHLHFWPDGWASLRTGKKAAGRLLDGVLYDNYPELHFS